MSDNERKIGSTIYQLYELTHGVVAQIGPKFSERSEVEKAARDVVRYRYRLRPDEKVVLRIAQSLLVTSTLPRPGSTVEIVSSGPFNLTRLIDVHCPKCHEVLFIQPPVDLATIQFCPACPYEERVDVGILIHRGHLTVGEESSP